MDPAYGRLYRELYRRHWWWRAREAVILEELERRGPRGRPWRILDVGCGDGLFFDALSRFGEVEGVEPDAGLLDPAGPWRGSIHAVPFDERFRPGRRYDVILMLDVLEHLAEPERALRHAVSLLADDGIAVVTVPAHQWLWTRHDDVNRHVRRYNRASLRALARAGGLAVLRERFLFQWLVPAKLAVRAIEALRPGPPTLPGIPPAPVNRLLTLVARAEQAVNAVVPMPFGSSLLMVGRRAPAPDPTARGAAAG